MRVLQLQEASQLEAGELVPAFKAQIKEVKDYHTGTNQYGAWSIQKLTVMDQGAVMKVKIFDHPEFTAQWVGHWVYFECATNDKGLLVGMKIVNDEYRGKITKLIEVKKDAKITQAQPGSAVPAQPVTQPVVQQPAHQQMPPPGAAPAPAPVTPAAPPAQQMPPPAQEQRTQPPPTKTKPSVAEVRQAIDDARDRLGRAANGLIMAYDAVAYVAETVHKKHPDITFGPEEMEKLAVHLSIILERGGLLFGLPLGPLDSWTKKEQAQSPTQP